MKYVHPHYYNLSVLIDAIDEPTPKSISKAFRKYRENGVHPFYLTQVQRAFGSSATPSGYAEIEVATRNIISEGAEVPSAQKKGLAGPASRLYRADGRPVRELDEGVLQGVLIELCLEIKDAFVAGTLHPATWVRDTAVQFASILNHPEATFALFDNAMHQVSIIGEGLECLGVAVDDGLSLQEVRHDFMKRQLQEAGPEELAVRMLQSWVDEGAFRFWVHVVGLLGTPIHDVIPEAQCPLSRFVRAILTARGSRDWVVKDAAHKALQFYPLSGRQRDGYDTETALAARAYLFAVLKKELPHPLAFHTIIRLLQAGTFNVQEACIFSLAFTGENMQIDEKAEFLVEEMLGEQAWTALCEFTKLSHWNEAFSTPLLDMPYRGSINTTTKEYAVFTAAFRKLPLNKHKGLLAERLDMKLHDTGVSGRAALAVREEAVELLSGDVIVPVTHLRSEWMPVTRNREGDFLTTTFPKVSVAAHPKLGENGTACAFRIHDPKIGSELLSGTLDPDGNSTIDGVKMLTLRGRTILEAVVAQTVTAILVPQYLDKVPPHLRGGGGITFTGEVRATRPIIHTLGDLTQKTRVEKPGGMKINPGVALFVFLWLTDEILDNPVRLFRMEREVIPETSVKEIFYRFWRSAKEKLRKREVRLSEVYFRTIRAHSRPVAVSMDGGDIVVRRMSNRAKRNYERFRQEGGRELDFSPIRKTYALSKSRRLVLDVPRTFNKGTFHTLEEVWEMIPDLQLKTKAKELFVF